MSTLSQNNPYDVIYMEVTLPKELSLTRNFKVTIKFHAKDIPKTWMGFFRKYNKEIFNFLQRNPDEYAIQGRRNKFTGFTMNNYIGEFINSFKRILQTYRARIVSNPSTCRSRRSSTHGQQQRVTSTRRAALLRTPAPARVAGNDRSDFLRGNRDRCAPTPFPATTGLNNFTDGGNLQANLSGAREPPPPNGLAPATHGVCIPTSGIEFWEHVGTDSNDSMASGYGGTDLDSSIATQDQMELGGGMLKINILRQITLYADNLGLLKMKQELQAKIENGTWQRFSRQHPHTARILVPAMGLTFIPTTSRQ